MNHSKLVVVVWLTLHSHWYCGVVKFVDTSLGRNSIAEVRRTALNHINNTLEVGHPQQGQINSQSEQCITAGLCHLFWFFFLDVCCIRRNGTKNVIEVSSEDHFLSDLPLTVGGKENTSARVGNIKWTMWCQMLFSGMSSLKTNVLV